jgi:hypothetical protein
MLSEFIRRMGFLSSVLGFSKTCETARIPEGRAEVAERFSNTCGTVVIESEKQEKPFEQRNKNIQLQNIYRGKRMRYPG